MKKLLAVTTYNRLNLLVKSLDSLVANTDDFDELLIVDDHSTDGTAEYIESYNINDKITSYSSPENKGVCESINYILKYYYDKYGSAEDIFLAKVEDDMSYTPHWLDKCLNLFEEFKEYKIGFVGGYFPKEQKNLGSILNKEGKEICLRTEMRGNCMIGRLNYWYSMYPIPEIIPYGPHKGERRGKPDGWHGSHNDWHFLRDHENSVERTGRICLIYPNLLKHEGSEFSCWNNKTVE